MEEQRGIEVYHILERVLVLGDIGHALVALDVNARVEVFIELDEL